VADEWKKTNGAIQTQNNPTQNQSFATQNLICRTPHVDLPAFILLLTTPMTSPQQCTTFEDIFSCVLQHLDKGWCVVSMQRKKLLGYHFHKHPKLDPHHFGGEC
jgi:hypothetical protein